MSLTAGALSQVSVGWNSCVLSTAVASGGTGPYTYQWYMSTVSGFTPGAGNLVSGATAASNQSFSALLPETTYYFAVVSTDTGNGNATVTSAQLTVRSAAALTATEKVHFAEALGSKAAATEILKCFALKTLPSLKTETIFASAMTDNVWQKKGTATWEIFNSITSGTTLSAKTQRKFAYVIGSPKLALKILNLIQTSPSLKITL